MAAQGIIKARVLRFQEQVAANCELAALLGGDRRGDVLGARIAVGYDDVNQMAGKRLLLSDPGAEQHHRAGAGLSYLIRQPVNSHGRPGQAVPRRQPEPRASHRDPVICDQQRLSGHALTVAIGQRHNHAGQALNAA